MATMDFTTKPQTPGCGGGRLIMAHNHNSKIQFCAWDQPMRRQGFSATLPDVAVYEVSTRN